MSVTIFIRTRDGNNNYEAEVPTKVDAHCSVERLRTSGGYWTELGTVFIPWHRVDYVELRGEDD